MSTNFKESINEPHDHNGNMSTSSEESMNELEDHCSNMSSSSKESDYETRYYVCRNCLDNFKKPERKIWKLLGEETYFCTDCSKKFKNNEESDLSNKFLVEISGNSEKIFKQVEEYIIPHAQLIKGFFKVDAQQHDLDVFQMYVVFRRKIHWDHIFHALCDNGNIWVRQLEAPKKLVNLNMNPENYLLFNKEMKSVHKGVRFLFDKRFVNKNQRKRLLTRLTVSRKKMNENSLVDKKIPKK